MMQIFLSPEMVHEDSQIINVVDQNGNAVGFVSFIIDEKKMYVQGHLEVEGVSEDFKDMIKPYIEGMTKSKEDVDVFTYLAVGGKSIDLEQLQGNQNSS